MSGAPRTVEELRYGVERYLSIKSAYSPVFSPDDSKIAYLSDLTGVPQAWTVELRGAGSEAAWPQQLTLGKERVGFVSWAKRLDLLAYGVDSGGDERFQIRLLESGGERFGMLTDNPSVIHSWGDWSPDDTEICYSSNERNPAFFDVYVKSVDGRKTEMVCQHDGNNYPMAWSPDGSAILFSRMHAPFNHDLYLLKLADKSVELLTPHQGDAVYQSATFDPSGEFVYCITDEGREFPALARLGVKDRSLEYLYTESWEFETLALSPDGKRLAYLVNDDGYSRLMLWEVGGGAPRPVSLPKGVVGGLSWSNSGKMLTFSLSSSTMNSDVWVYDASDGSVRRLTHSSTCGIPESSFVEERLKRFASFDGLDVPAFFYAPHIEGRVPLLAYLHGGPESQFRPGFSPLIQYILSLGIAVVAPNFRGSTGYGRRYTHLDDVYKRMDTVKDSVAAVTEAQMLMDVDPRKIVAMGGSYGGFMVLACLYSYPDIWALGIDIVGISNFVTFLNNTGPWRRKLRIAEYGDPVADKEFLEKISPTNNAHLIKAPLFIIHGANDPRVPAGEAGQMVQTLESLGRSAYLLIFPDEGHGLVKLNNRVEGYSKALGFMLAHLAEPPVDPK
ncbi:MAG: S9 family peptidase [Thaumarchaeota archaeon]|nr:S9 family peptidase [Nitrososphaerota archaeon]